ncbi:MAG TPA: NAD(P)-dependent alcohol dehydrogenase [Bacteroidia bacterium]|nr:NAD(P)-dependent alcohol dehydrogenase [Bacteroidia bacterium]
MKAAVYHSYGPPEVVKIVEVALPQIKEKELLIKVHASTVNRTDCGFRSAEYFISRFWSGLFYPKNKILGCEFAGVVESIGKDVNNFKIGDHVFGFKEQFGTHAEYMVMDSTSSVALIPEGFGFYEAAPFLEGAHYALNNIKAAQVKSGDLVLVNGATGAIGSAAVQILKAMNIQVTAICPSKQIDLVKSLGADVVIDFEKEDFTKLKSKHDFIFDAVGKSSFFKCKHLLKPKGIYISTELGYLSQNPFLALITPLFGGKKLLFPIPSISQQDALYFKKLAEERKYKPLIDRSYTLDKIVDAYIYVEGRQKIGNVVVKIVDVD